MYTEQLTQGLSIPATPVHPQTLNNSAASTGGVDMSKFKRVMFIVDIGSVTGGGSITAKLQQCATSGGSYTDVTNGAATAETASSKVITLEISSSGLTQQFVRCTLTETGSQNVVCQCAVIAGEAEQKPADQSDNAVVVQRLVV